MSIISQGMAEQQQMKNVIPFEGGITRSSLADTAYEKLLHLIVTGRLREGTELVAGTIAEQLGVSRTPVVEAIKRLSSDGFVEQPANRRARVARFSQQDIVEVYEMRMLLEPTAAEKAASVLSEGALSQLRTEADELLDSIGDSDWCERALDYDIRFHQVLAEAAGNTRLSGDINRYRLLVRGFCRIAGMKGNLEQAFREHRDILSALESRDAERAGQLMRRHIRARLEAVLRQVAAETVSDSNAVAGG